MNINVKMESKSVFIIILITLFLGLSNIIFNISFCRNIHIYSMILGFLPLTILIIRNIKYYKNKNIISVLTPSVIIICIAIFCINIFMTKKMDLSGIVTDANSYKKILRIKSNTNNNLIDHFPTEIPKYSRGVKFKEWVNITGNVEGCYLSYVHNNKTDLINNINKNKHKSKYVANSIDEINSIKEDIMVPSLVEDMLKISEDDDIKLIIIDGSSILDYKSGYCYGIGINLDKNIILYFEEKW